MTIEVVREVADRQSAQPVLNALDAYIVRLRADIQRTRRKLREYEDRYAVSTDLFLQEIGGRRPGWRRPGIR